MEKTSDFDSTYLTFQINSFDFSIQSRLILEILDDITPSPVPIFFTHCEGMYYFRDHIIPILHFKDILFHSPTINTSTVKSFPKIILVVINGYTFGIVVDRIMKLIKHPEMTSTPIINIEDFPQIQTKFIHALQSTKNISYMEINLPLILKEIFNYP